MPILRRKSPPKRIKKDLIKEKQAKKAKERSTHRKIERLVEENFDFENEICPNPASSFRTTPTMY